MRYRSQVDHRFAWRSLRCARSPLPAIRILDVVQPTDRGAGESAGLNPEGWRHSDQHVDVAEEDNESRASPMHHGTRLAVFRAITLSNETAWLSEHCWVGELRGEDSGLEDLLKENPAICRVFPLLCATEVPGGCINRASRPYGPRASRCSPKPTRLLSPTAWLSRSTAIGLRSATPRREFGEASRFLHRNAPLSRRREDAGEGPGDRERAVRAREGSAPQAGRR